jgi:3,4-dihydroxy 2-butanone 4-phosphate synthase / GTP cyclohydrolase II
MATTAEPRTFATIDEALADFRAGMFVVVDAPDRENEGDLFAQIGAEERGVLLYMAQEGRGIGLLNKLRAYELQEQGRDTVEANLELGFPADSRDYGIGYQILADLGLSTIRLLTNNPRKVESAVAYGLMVTEQVPIEVPPDAQNVRYLQAKRAKLGHRLHHQDLKFEPEEQ